MKAMIMAAGYGKRMGALTDQTPKPLLNIDEWCLIERLLLQLADVNITEIVINISYLANHFIKRLGDGHRYGVTLYYSHEETPLHWGGGIIRALPRLGPAPFLAISGDLSTDYPFDRLCAPTTDTHLAHLVLTDQGRGHPDFDLTATNIVTLSDNPQYTYGGIGRFDPVLFQGCHKNKPEFLDIMRTFIHNKQVTGEIYTGHWINVNTPQCLSQIQKNADMLVTEEGANRCDIGLEP